MENRRRSVSSSRSRSRRRRRRPSRDRSSRSRKEIRSGSSKTTKLEVKTDEQNSNHSSSRKSRRDRSRSRSNSVKREKKITEKTPESSPERDDDRRRRTRKIRKKRSVSSSSSSSASEEKSSPTRRRSPNTPPRRRKKKAKNDESSSKVDKNDENGDKTPPRKEKELPKPNILMNETIRGRTGGVYIPPFKLARMQKELGQQQQEDKASEDYQRKTFQALRKSINGLINKVNVSNISHIVPELFQENLVRGRGLFARAVMKAQLASPGFTHIYAALLSVINTKLPENGELIVKRVVFRFRKALKRGDKVVTIALARFIAHLVNQQIVHELLALQLLTVLLSNPTDDSVEIAVNFTKECGEILGELCPKGLVAIFETFRSILHEGDIDKRVQYTIEGLFAIRKGGFADYPAVHQELDLVESADQISHEVKLEDKVDVENMLDVFRFDPKFEENEQMWKEIRKEILGESDSDSSGSGSGSDSDSEEEPEANEVVNTGNGEIQDFTEQDLVNLRRTIYLTIMSSISHEECAHKLLKLNVRPGQESEICSMLIQCCSQERTYLKYYGLLGQRFCLLKREYQAGFDEHFSIQYSMIHRLETNKLRNVAKFFSHLLYTDALPWTVFEYIRLNEEETTSSSRIFIKILCQELSEHMGLKKLKERFTDDYMQTVFAGVFPRDNPRNTRFAINFFTSIGLGGLTDDLREYLKNAPKMIMASSKSSDESSSSSSSDSDSSGSSSDSGSSSSGSSGSDSDSDSSSSSDSD